jgi:molecular chaperone IbpA
MRAFDFAPFSRSTVGFDRLFEMLNADRADTEQAYPPYDIIRTGEDTFCISLALAGFNAQDITITAQQNLLTVAGRKPENARPDYLYQGIPTRAFERRFDLADYVEVEGASFENGMLQIVLARRVPEAQKPRRIPIGGDAFPKVVEGGR